VTLTARIEDLLRELAPQVLGAVVRRYGDFDAAEDAVQEALLAAAMHWPAEGLPDNPRGWFIQTAVRRLTDQYRSDQARRRRRSRPPCARCALSSRCGGTTRWCCCSCAASQRSVRRPRSR
jgi:predicted RNA polymerase sigma factor